MEAVKGFRPVAVNIGVKDIGEAVRFYQELFGARLDTEETDGRVVHARAVFGAGASFFLLNIRERDADDPHRDHVTAFGLNVDDLDAAHSRAVAAGAREHFAPMDSPGLPRHSRFQDPSGNRIVLWQALGRSGPPCVS